MRYVLVMLFFICKIGPIVSKDVTSIDHTRLSTIYFQFNATIYRDSISSERYQMEYAAMKELMDANPEINLGIHGYQNTMEQVNLSKARAQKVKQDLIQVGVPKDRMNVIQEPSIAVTGSTVDAERALTQKVVFAVVKRTE